MEFKIDNILETINQLLQQEDTDNDKKITIQDEGPKAFIVKTSDGKEHWVKSTYHLSNLLQELFLELEQGKEATLIPIEKIEELPANRISRLIKEYYWDSLTRTIDEEGIEKLIKDTKNKNLEKDELVIYVPFDDEMAMQYYQNLEHQLPIKVQRLPKDITPEFTKSINDKPGILALAMETSESGLRGKPFVVPGARFNEMYGWDSYFESIGLMLDGRIDLAKSMADHFQYEIQHYGKILNANRSYYLTRTQPPFYSSLVKLVYEKSRDKEWLKSHLPSIIKEYENVWMSKPRLTPLGLNRYFAQGIGMPPETEEGHYDAVIKPFADKANMSIQEYLEKFKKNEIQEPELQEYFVHDRSVRESGHDTSYRMEGKAIDMVMVELNALLYQYENDLAEWIENECDGNFDLDGKPYTSDYFKKRGEERKAKVNQYLWNEEEGFYFDFNLKNNDQESYVSATGVAPLWSHLSSAEQASRVVEKMMKELKEKGGIVSGTEQSRGLINDTRPAKQWDFPYGWAPHQMMIWKGLQNYGFDQELQELVYRWLYMITKNAVDYSGTIPEKYDVVQATHLVFVEYGNVGTDFEYITKEGFGWMNASFQLGLKLLNKEYLTHLNNLTPPEKLFE